MLADQAAPCRAACTDEQATRASWPRQRAAAAHASESLLRARRERAATRCAGRHEQAARATVGELRASWDARGRSTPGLRRRERGQWMQRSRGPREGRPRRTRHAPSPTDARWAESDAPRRAVVGRVEVGPRRGRACRDHVATGALSHA
jgi:hypothetical protein